MLGENEYKNYTSRRNSKFLRNTIIALAVLLVSTLVATWFISHGSAERQSIYGQIKDSGYAGTQEQLLASLAGEDLKDQNAPSAYELACDHGYKGSFRDWMKVITGVDSRDEKKTAYAVACENGYNGSLTQWLTKLAYRPNELGKSKDSSKKTEYELACEFGYKGTFIEWVVSVSHDKIF